MSTKKDSKNDSDVVEVFAEKSKDKRNFVVSKKELSSSKVEEDSNNIKPKDKIKKGVIKWLIKVLVIAVFLSLFFSIITEIVYNAIQVDFVKMIIAVILVLLIVIIAITADMVSVAATSCDVEPYLSMASRKVKGAKRAVWLCKNADKVSSIFGDIIGDVCSIISGASGATIAVVIQIQLGLTDPIPIIVTSALVSAVIAAVTITGKAICKKIAVSKANNIIFSLAKLLSVFDK
ncbi:MAG: hypothetical protein RR248_03335 [Clostridia bacterium]